MSSTDIGIFRIHVDKRMGQDALKNLLIKTEKEKGSSRAYLRIRSEASSVLKSPYPWLKETRKEGASRKRRNEVITCRTVD